MSTENKKSPVFVTADKKLSVYQETKTIQNGERAGESYTYFNVYSPEEKMGIDIPSRWAGHDITPAEAADLADGFELLIERTSKKLAVNPETGAEEPKRYTQIFSPLPIDERKGDTVTFRSRKIATGFPTFSRTNPEEISMISTSNYDASGAEIEASRVASYRYIGPKKAGDDGVERGMVKVTVADLTLALKAIAKGEKYEIVGPGYRVPATGIKLPAADSKLSPMLEWGRVIFERESGAATEGGDELPSEGAASKGRRA